MTKWVNFYSLHKKVSGLKNLFESVMYLFLQLILSLWIFISCQTSMEVVLGGQYDSELPCFYRDFFIREVLLSMTIVYPVYSLVIFILNIAIILKVKCAILRRNELGKFTWKSKEFHLSHLLEKLSFNFITSNDQSFGFPIIYTENIYIAYRILSYSIVSIVFIDTSLGIHIWQEFLVMEKLSGKFWSVKLFRYTLWLMVMLEHMPKL